MEKIPTKFSTLDRVLQNRPDVLAEQVSVERKQKWVAQIEHSMLALHSIGVVWCDAKPGNVLIGEDDNAWLLDFGGGFTQPWMEPSLAGMPEGDIYAFRKIRAALLNLPLNLKE